jgi:hypothetical protein
MPKNDETVEAGGTHLQGEVDASYAELVALFGEPGEGDGYKVDAHWALRFDDLRRTVATVYNYKDGRNYLEDEGKPVEEIREWHVGGFTPAAAQLVREALVGYRRVEEANAVGPLVPISALRPQADYLVRGVTHGETFSFGCVADDWNHAASQALDFFPGGTVTQIEVRS